MRLDPVRTVQAVIVLFVAALVLSEALLYFPGARPQLVVDQRFQGLGAGQWALYTNGSGSFDANIEQAVVAVIDRGAPATLDYYFDASYPLAFNTVADWFGLTQHLQTVASARGVSLNFTLVNARQLGQLLSQPPRASTLLVLVSGVLPDTVYAPPKNLLLPWINRGGTVFWVGPPLGEYEGIPLAPGASYGRLLTIPNGSRAFLPNVSLGGNTLVYGNASAWATALYLDYPYAVVNGSFLSTAVTSSHGEVFGYGDAQWSNWATFSIGNGSLIDLAAPGYDVVRLSFTMVNLLQSGAWSPGSVLEGYSSFALSPGHPYHARSLWGAPGSGVHLCALSVESDYLAPFASSSCT